MVHSDTEGRYKTRTSFFTRCSWGEGRQTLADLRQRITRSQTSCGSSLQVSSSTVGPALEWSSCAQLQSRVPYQRTQLRYPWVGHWDFRPFIGQIGSSQTGPAVAASFLTSWPNCSWWQAHQGVSGLSRHTCFCQYATNRKSTCWTMRIASIWSKPDRHNAHCRPDHVGPMMTLHGLLFWVSPWPSDGVVARVLLYG